MTYIILWCIIIDKTKEGDNFMYCKNCGTFISEEQSFCPKCGAAKGEIVKTTNTGKKIQPFALVGFIRGVVSFFLDFYCLVSVCAIVFSGISLKKFDAEPNVYSGKGFAKAGLILGIIAAAFNLLVMIACTAFLAELGYYL